VRWAPRDAAGVVWVCRPDHFAQGASLLRGQVCSGGKFAQGARPPKNPILKGGRESFLPAAQLHHEGRDLVLAIARGESNLRPP